MTHPSSSPPSEVYGQVFHLAYPIVVSMLGTTLMGITDTFFMGWVGTNAQAGLGLGGILAWTYSSFFVGTLTVVNTFTSQHFGAKSYRRCGAAAWQGLLIAAGFSLVILVSSSRVPWLVGLFGAPETVSSIAARYTFIRVWGLPLQLAETCLTSFMRGIGDTRTPMKVSFGMVLLNVPLNTWFIFGGLGLPALGPDGAAYATVLAQGFGALVLLLLFLRRPWRETYGTGLRRGHLGRELPRMLKVGLPIGVSWVMEMATWTIFTVFVSTFGEKSLAAHNIVLQVLQLSFMPGVGLSVAATTLVGQHIGARDPTSASRVGYAALKLGMTYMAFMGLLFLLFGGTIAHAFNRDPQVITLARRLFVLAAVFQVFDAMGMVSNGILRGAGDTRWPMVANICFAWLVFIPLIWLLGSRLDGGVRGSWIGATVYIIGLGITLLLRVVAGRWKSCRVVESAEGALRQEAPLPDSLA